MKDLFDHLYIEQFLFATLGRLTSFEYILHDTSDSINLVTFEWFTIEGCNQPAIEKINSMNKTTLKWDKKLETLKKYRNFYNCKLISGVTLEIKNTFYIDKFSDKPKGLLVDIFMAMSKYVNFNPWIQIVSFDLQTRPEKRVPSDYFLFQEHKKIQVLHEIRTQVDSNYHVSMTFAESSLIFLITPGEPYTISEKLFLPFDDETWIWLTLTFVVTFIVILILNRMPLKYQNIVYGEGITTPTLNIVFIFFGLGQMKVPEKAYPRFLLLSFIVFCLIFRTCYQSKLFEFMTSDMRKPSPETINDLYYQNFTIVTVGYSHIMNTLENMIEESKRPKIQAFTNIYDFNQEFFQQRENYSARLAFYLPNDQLPILGSVCKCSPRILKQSLFTHQYGISTFRNHFLFELTDEIVQRFIPMGIIQHSYEFHTWVNFRNIVEDVESTQKVLDVDDLAYGFYIWLGACGISIIGFLLELVAHCLIVFRQNCCDSCIFGRLRWCGRIRSDPE
ncbi:unnamed protein product [Chironomus riparius]|uniref:Ionotropic glutamate receptor C-terminal domain-containing protein n=1 Tax=Chironomus riparius TaxID=315576 RepID=A0A9N9WYB4_9DIPT|nr:unnamed protein product [Chironomus riparius]